MIRIIADGGADIEKEILDRYNIEILKISMTCDNVEYRFDDNIDEFYNMMREGKVFKTSQVSYGLLLETFEKYIQAGDEILYYNLSSGITGGYATAVSVRNEMLEKYPQAKIVVFDSLSATIGFGMLLEKAGKMVEDGLTFEEIIEKSKKLIPKIEHVYTVATLEYLYRGGRVSKTSAFIGGLLNIRPIMGLDKKDGRLFVIEKAKGKKQTMKKFTENIQKLCKDGKFDKNQKLLLAHGQCEEELMEFKDYIKEAIGIDEDKITVHRIGPIVGAHTGPEIVVASFLSEVGEFREN